MISINRFLKLLCALCLCICAQAQTGKVDLHFLSFPKATDPEPLELLIGENETIEVQLPTNHISQAYSVPALPNWTLGKSSAPDARAFSFNSYGNTPSIRSPKQLVLVTRSGSKNSNDIQLTTLDFSTDAFGGGQYLFINATEVDIAGIIGEQKFALKPGKSTLVTPEATKTRGDLGYSYARFFFRNKDKAKGFFSATWRLNEKAQSMVFFYHDPGTEQIRLHIIRSFLSGA
ncbi:hypothetical protein DDZ13_11360 [Coraliomargarita sinensis]|uniref:Uncharacterized protein n=1 Tax=Coraliomargarita sinensis TaxID=2174842 RepID=A0A317ZJN3_9BACT|nr:hypothetical protein [Coraliomargarita sinensis]PXA03571.1 hypothetical protein DDZ13_11360 [Coraliomargarita sinensis]